MKQGVLSNQRVRLLLTKNHSCYRARRAGERKRKSVRGCIVGADLSVLNLRIVEVGKTAIPGLTDDASGVPLRLGPKRASKIRKIFALTKEDDVRQYVVKREFTNKKGKKVTKAPKIQRLVTPMSLQRRRRRLAAKKQARTKATDEAAAYKRLLTSRNSERRQSEAARRSSRKRSRASKVVVASA